MRAGKLSQIFELKVLVHVDDIYKKGVSHGSSFIYVSEKCRGE